MAPGFIDRVLVWLGLEPEEVATAGEGTSDSGEPPARPAGRRGRVVSLPGALAASGGVGPRNGSEGGSPGPAVASGVSSSVQVIICHPQTLDEVEAVATHLKARRPVLVSLKRADRETARRIVDFLSGTVYALDGVMRPVGDDVVLCAPGGVDVKLEGLDSE